MSTDYACLAFGQVNLPEFNSMVDEEEEERRDISLLEYMYVYHSLAMCECV